MRKEAMAGIYKLAQRDPRVVFIGSDLGAGTLDDMRREMPERWFMEGVSEQAIIGLEVKLSPAQGDAWLKDSRGEFDEEVRNPWE